MAPQLPPDRREEGRASGDSTRAGFLLWNPDLADRALPPGRGPVPADAQVRPWLRLSPSRGPPQAFYTASLLREARPPLPAGSALLALQALRLSPIVGYERGGGVCRPGDATRRLRRPEL